MSFYASKKVPVAKAVGAAALAVVAGLGALASPAAAATPDEGPSTFRLVGFDAEAARANGYEVVTLPDGSTASVPAEQAAAARAGTYKPTTVLKPVTKRPSTTDDAYAEKAGECGRSYVSLNSIGSQNANLGTGMFLDNPDAGNPWDVHWTVHITDNGGVSNQNYSESDGLLAGNSWIARNRKLHLTHGYALAKVTSGYTLTTHGWICYSYSPEVEEFIS